MCDALFSSDIRSWTPRLESCALQCVSASGGRCYYLPRGLQTTMQSSVVSGNCHIHNSLVIMGSYRQEWRKLRHKWLYTDADFNTPNKCFSLLQRQINYLAQTRKYSSNHTHNWYIFNKKRNCVSCQILKRNRGKLCPSGLTKLWRPSVAPLRSTSRDAREVTAVHHS
jgi:hypothetical protein